MKNGVCKISWVNFSIFNKKPHKSETLCLLRLDDLNSKWGSSLRHFPQIVSLWLQPKLNYFCFQSSTASEKCLPSFHPSVDNSHSLTHSLTWVCVCPGRDRCAHSACRIYRAHTSCPCSVARWSPARTGSLRRCCSSAHRSHSHTHFYSPDHKSQQHTPHCTWGQEHTGGYKYTKKSRTYGESCTSLLLICTMNHKPKLSFHLALWLASAVMLAEAVFVFLSGVC